MYNVHYLEIVICWNEYYLKTVSFSEQDSSQEIGFIWSKERETGPVCIIVIPYLCIIVIVIVFSCLGSSLPDLGRRQYNFRILTQKVTFES